MRPTILRAAFEKAGVMPSTSRDLLVMAADAIKSKRGYKRFDKKSVGSSDGPRPKWAGPVTMFGNER